jgi:hypothetical protein
LAGFADCDSIAANGCEAVLATDPHNCGACGISCASAPCVDGVCQEAPPVDTDAGTDAGIDTDADVDIDVDPVRVPMPVRPL